jgi:hypothetical protein
MARYAAPLGAEGPSVRSEFMWKGDMTPEEATAVIERFLGETPDSTEWCDFAETKQPRGSSFSENAATS